MSEKRFTVMKKFDGSYVICDKGKMLVADDCCDLLNDLYEERNYFERKKCEYWNKFNLAHLDNINLQEENEQLRQQLQEYKENWDDMVELATKTSLRNVELDEQNGQLRQQLKEKEEDERLYANEIVKLNKEAKEVLDFKSLGGDY